MYFPRSYYVRAFTWPKNVGPKAQFIWSGFWQGFWSKTPQSGFLIGLLAKDHAKRSFGRVFGQKPTLEWAFRQKPILKVGFSPKTHFWGGFLAKAHFGGGFLVKKPFRKWFFAKNPFLRWFYGKNPFRRWVFAKNPLPKWVFAKTHFVSGFFLQKTQLTSHYCIILTNLFLMSLCNDESVGLKCHLIYL